jgi:hypothetical protein
MTNPDWRHSTLDAVRALIKEAEPTIKEEQKWRKPSRPDGVPVWSLGGIICTGEIYKDYVKLTFAHGVALPDPTSLFNASLDAGTRRAINIFEDNILDKTAFKNLINNAVAFNIKEEK